MHPVENNNYIYQIPCLPGECVRSSQKCSPKTGKNAQPSGCQRSLCVLKGCPRDMSNVDGQKDPCTQKSVVSFSQYCFGIK